MPTFQSILNRFGSVDLFINNAGVGRDEMIILKEIEKLEKSWKAIDLTIDINLMAVMRWT